MYTCCYASMMISNAPVAVLELIEHWSVMPKFPQMQELPKSQKIISSASRNAPERHKSTSTRVPECLLAVQTLCMTLECNRWAQKRFFEKYVQASLKNPKIEIDQKVKYDAETHSNGFLIGHNNVFLDFNVIHAFFEKCLKSQITIMG